MDAVVDQVKKGRKFEQVLDGAREVFLTDGFEGASVDTIAKAAGVSKATLYSYFPDKRMLFMEVAKRECRAQADRAVAEIDRLRPPREVLSQAARHMLRFLLSDMGQQVFRLSVAETDRFPDIGCHFYESGPKLVRETLAAYLDEATSRGELRIDDTALAADQFAELCKADLFPRMVFGMQTHFTEDEIARVIDGAVEMFMARYGV